MFMIKIEVVINLEPAQGTCLVCETCAEEYMPDLLGAVVDYNISGDGDIRELMRRSVVIEPTDEESATRAVIEEVKIILEH